MSKDSSLQNLFISSRDLLTRVVSRIVPPKEIEDIVQETYVRICQIDNAERIQSPRSFMLKTAKNLAFDYLKSANVKWMDGQDVLEVLELNADSTDQMFEAAASKEEFADFCEAVRLLPLQSRKAFILKKVYGHSQKEIAQQLNISESTVEKHIATGMKKCMQFMQQRQHQLSDKQSSKLGGQHE
ncbi:RNA polymerase sigma factor [Catenovulum agarivorans]|uniref:RNA polymerase sigma factor n=1 Tax=Catenovulum agarivorans TaxID=1172192 RepID=UPI000316350E|nr:RNA polymerase sigma factor [Catenovulum agarivorans]